MKKNIFTLLVTASILAATPVFAMDDSDFKTRAFITAKTTDLSAKALLTDLTTKGSFSKELL